MTLNMLRPANAAPNVSAYMYVYSNHDFNAHPLAPLGCAVQLYERPETRHTWDSRTTDGWYIGTSFEHYTNYKVWVKETRAERISDTVWFRHKYITNPSLTTADYIVNAANDLAQALDKNQPQALKPSSKEALSQLAKIFNEVAVKISNKEAEKNARLPGVDRQSRANRTAATPGVRNTRSQARNAPSPGVQAEARDQQDSVSNNTRNRATRRETRSITHEAALSAMEFSSVPIKARQLAKKKFPLALICEIAGAVLDPETGDLLEYRHLLSRPKYKEVWTKASTKEMGRLAQGVPGLVEGTDTIFFKSYDEIPPDRRKDVTYSRFVCNERPEKEDPNRVRITVGGDRVNYPYDVGTPTADII